MKKCPTCGQEFEGGAYCPRCGASVPDVVYVQQAPAQKNTTAQWGMILSCLGFLFNICAIIGIIMSIVGLVKAKDYNGDGKGMAIAGIIIGACVLILYVIVLIIYIAILVPMYMEILDGLAVLACII